MVIGASRVEQVEQDVDALDGREFSENELARIEKILRDVR